MEESEIKAILDADEPTKEFIEWAHSVLFIPDKAHSFTTVQDMWLAYQKGIRDTQRETVKPVVHGKGTTHWYACGDCLEAIDTYHKFCPSCGVPIDRSE